MQLYVPIPGALRALQAWYLHVDADSRCLHPIHTRTAFGELVIDRKSAIAQAKDF